jgi:hypothetical protein
LTLNQEINSVVSVQVSYTMQFNLSLFKYVNFQFYPDDDVMYPHRKFPMFGSEIECWQMQAFFERIKYSDDSLNCRLAQSFNHICGCEGSGYAGANTDAKKAALVWLPRIMAILSILVSICMLNMILPYNKT